MRKTLFLARAAACLAALTLFNAPASGAQDGAGPKADAPKAPAAKVDEKAEAVVKRAVEVLGGAAYLDEARKVT